MPHLEIEDLKGEFINSDKDAMKGLANLKKLESKEEDSVLKNIMSPCCSSCKKDIAPGEMFICQEIHCKDYYQCPTCKDALCGDVVHPPQPSKAYYKIKHINDFFDSDSLKEENTSEGSDLGDSGTASLEKEIVEMKGRIGSLEDTVKDVRDRMESLEGTMQDVKSLLGDILEEIRKERH
ncbi:hypothetical protein M422DRAFT_255911 [Sphaerobolus stellatus SS14]|uniref:Uncharacterized protein n=1 Tax=Sphaerobolus stellatus (strain SS14) TaxID=990650 RepID=A0A0C9VI14_SPHS4|nr:hypothetical protein M422DRAFT_255911 [Sphaerobolus stellatus SS14]